MKKKTEYSKKICTYSLFSFSIVVLMALVGAILGFSSEIFAYLIPSVGAVATASVVFYYNKAKTENLSKQRIRNVMLKLVLEEKLSPEDYEEIIAEIETIDAIVDAKLYSSLEESVNQDTEIEL
jgi:hypothetical protein